MNQCDTLVINFYACGCRVSVAEINAVLGTSICDTTTVVQLNWQEVGQTLGQALQRCPYICGYVISESRAGSAIGVFYAPCCREGRVVKQTLAIEQDKNEHCGEQCARNQSDRQ